MGKGRDSLAVWTKGDGLKGSTELSDLLDCPVCFEPLRPPIWQCNEGHTLCDKCKAQLCDCPTCRISLRTLSRNRALEEVMRRTAIVCKNADYGCNVTYPLDRMLEHEEKCHYRALPCPHYHGWRHKVCRWMGSMGDVVDHLVKVHSVTITDLPNTPVASTVQRVNNTLGHSGADWGPFLHRYKGRCFLLEFFHSAKDRDYRATLRCIKGEKECVSYYQIQVSRHCRKLLWEGVVRSVRDNPKDIIESNDCFTLKENLAIFFSDNEHLGTEGLDKLECDIKLRISLSPFGDS